MTRLVLATAILSVLSQTESIAGSPGGAMELGAGLRAVADERGVWQLRCEKGTLLSRGGLRVWGREGLESQSSARVLEPPSEGALGRAFHAELRVGSRRAEFWQTLTPVPNGLMVQYAVAAGELADGEGAAACFELPLATFADATFAVDGAKPVGVPAEKGTEPRLIEQEATSLAVQRNGGGLAFQRRPRGKTIVQDGRHWGNPWLEVQLYARRAVGDPPGWRSVSFLVTVQRGAETPRPQPPVIAAVAPGKAAVGCGEVHEAEVCFWAPFENPYDPAQVAVWAEVMGPTQPRAAVPHAGFFARDYVRSREGDAERLSPVGHGRWRVRMAAADAGTWTYVVKVRTPGGTAESKPISFSTAGSKGQRFLRAPKAQGPYLETADGAPCFLIGHNYCWPPGKERTYGVEGAFARMAAAGMNATRLWLCSWGLHIEGEEPDDYRLDDAWRLDLVFQAARERGIYVQLCLDNFADFTTKKGAERNPYLAANGGPCQTAPQFFSNAKAREQYQRRLRYLAARYAPFTSLLAWELFNEVSHAGEGPRDPAVVEWAANSAAQLKKLDPYGHPVTISVGLRSDWDALWRLPEIDLVEAHTYIPRPTNGAPPQETDSPALILAERDALDGHGKPVLVAEFGFMGTKEFNPLNEADKTGVHLHSALWASALGGCAGTALHWWWDSYLAEHDLYYHYAALASFLRGTELPGPRWAPVRSKAGSQLRVVGYRGREAALLWIQNAANTWHRRLIEGRDPVAIGRATVEVPRLADGRYRVEWWDTYTGEPLTHTTEETAGGTLLLRVPERVPDVACKVSRLER